MLNRRILRIKAFKELYAMQMSVSPSLPAAEKELDSALESTRDLYLFMLASIPAITRVAKARQERLSMKINKTEEERHPNLKFIGNALAVFFDNDPDFQRIIRKKPCSWESYDLILQKIYASVREKDYFAEYMAQPTSSLAADCRLFVRIFEEEFVDREDLSVALEDINIYWNDDLAYSLTWCCRTLNSVAKGKPWRLPELFISSGNASMDDDNLFVHKLLREAFINNERFCEAISSTMPNWDKERLVGTDIALIVTALAEMEAFPEIPLKVSINEYVEISKYFGTPKSSIFVNGVLDAISRKVEFKKNKL